MKKIINAPENYVTEMLEGLYLAHPDLITHAGEDLHCLISANKVAGKVAIVTGGGSGHLPLFLGYVGKGMLDGCGVGDVFQSPSPEQILEITKAVDSGAGVLYLYGNYNGDIFNFDMAAEQADFEEDIRVETVIAGDDVASEGPKQPGDKNTRRGVAGIVFVYKVAGAAAAAMLDLDEVKRVTEKAAANTRTMGVALSPCTVPRVGKPSFEMADDEMGVGMGIHGESGIRVGKLETADEITVEIMDKIIADIPYVKGDEVVVLVNGLGATPLDEQYIVTRKVGAYLQAQGIDVHRYYVGNYVTSMEMAGLSISVMKLDEELKKYIDAPGQTPFFTQL